MDKLPISRAGHEAFITAIDDLQKIAAQLGRAAAEIDSTAQPQAWYSLNLLKGVVENASHFGGQLADRYEPVSNAQADLYDQPLGEDSLLHAFDETARKPRPAHRNWLI